MELERIDRQCSAFCRYLIGQTPDARVVAKYREFHELSVASETMRDSAIDRLLVSVAELRPIATLLADAYCRVFLPRAILRKKLILLLAILESSAPYSELIGEVPSSSVLRAWTRILVAVINAIIVLMIAVALIAPIHLLLALRSKRAIGLSHNL